jgi:CBS domain-containing protein
MDLPRNLRSESVSRLHPTQAHLVQPTQFVADAIKVMRAKKVGCVLVCEQRRIVGIFTERDLLRRCSGGGEAAIDADPGVHDPQPRYGAPQGLDQLRHQAHAKRRISPSAGRDR